MKKEDNHGMTERLPPETFEEIAEKALGLSYHKILFKTGKELRDTSGRKLLEVCMKSRILTGSGRL